MTRPEWKNREYYGDEYSDDRHHRRESDGGRAGDEVKCDCRDNLSGDYSEREGEDADLPYCPCCRDDE